MAFSGWEITSAAVCIFAVAAGLEVIVLQFDFVPFLSREQSQPAVQNR